MRLERRSRQLAAKKSVARTVLIAAMLVVGTLTAYSRFAPEAQAAPPGAPVITSFVLTDLGSNNWRLSGTVTASEGLEGMVLYFGGLVDDTDAPDTNGSFSLDVIAEPIPGDWATVYAIDRFALQSDTVTKYF